MQNNKNYSSFIQKQLPSELYISLMESLDNLPHTSLRLNPKKTATLKVEAKQIAHCEQGFVLANRPKFIADPAFHGGLYYVQESNSMWIGEIVKSFINTLPSAAIVLDLCAAPGGKSTHISSVLRNSDLLVANEVISSRNSILYENLCKWGIGNFLVTKADAREIGIQNDLFDIIVCDVPCSGEGLFRKDTNSKNEWSLENVNLCGLRQQRIIFDIWNSLKPGGILIYSTCTYNTVENEDNVNKFVSELGAELVELEIFNNSTLYSLEPKMYRCFPFLTMGEGFFFAVLKKPEYASRNVKKITNNKKIEVSKFRYQNQELSTIKSKSESYFLSENGYIESNASILNYIPNIVHFGTPMGQEFHGEHKFHPAFALHFSEKKPFPVIDIPLELTSKYFRKEFINEILGPKGVVGLRWNNYNIGTANSIKNGLNNLWPNEWRVRDTVVAESIIE